MSGDHALSVLILADDQKGHAGTIHDHIQAFPRYSRHRIRIFNPRGLARSRWLDLDQFDVVVLHYSLCVLWDDYVSPAFREQIAAYEGLKVQFLQDEYRWVDEIAARMRAMGIGVLYSIVPEHAVEHTYGSRLPETEILPTLAGYVPEDLVGRTVPSLSARWLDVGYRGRSVPFWLGRLGNEKIEIGRRFLELAPRYGLRCDIGWTESARIYGERWYAFVASCRATLASESGASIVDFDGSVERAVHRYLAAHPTAPYEEVEREVLAPFTGGPPMNVASPRVFEAAGLRTAMVMFPGEYSGIVRPWEHYVPLEKDFSNMDEVVERIRDDRFLEELTARSYDELVASRHYSYERFMHEFDAAMAERATSRGHADRHPAGRLRLEQLSTGRSYRVSGLYWLARDLVLRYLGLRHSARRRALLRLALRLQGAEASREDLLRLAILTGVQEGTIVPATDPFRVGASLDGPSGRLTLTSFRPEEAAPDGNGSVREEVARALRGGELREIVWNHATVGQYVGIHFTPARKRISFDVGRYDTYGVYRFDELVGVAREDPDLVLEALEPLLRPSPYRSAT